MVKIGRQYIVAEQLFTKLNELVWSFLLLVLGAYSAVVLATPGQPLVWHFDTNSVAWDGLYTSVVASDDGLVYWGNQYGIVEFDGHRATLLPQSEGHRYGRLLKDLDGNIWASAQDKVSLIVPNGEFGATEILDVTNRIPATGRPFNLAYHIVSTTQGVFVMGRQQMIRIPRGAVTDPTVVFDYWQTPLVDEFRSVTEIAGDLLVVKDTTGLLKLRNGQLEADERGPILANKHVTQLMPVGDSIVFCTRDEGVFRLDGDRPVELSDALQRIVKGAIVSDCGTLPDGRHVVSTVSEGVVLFDDEGTILEHFSKGSGLTNSWVDDLPVLDKSGGLWVPSGTGMSRIALGLPIRQIVTPNLPGTVVTIRRFEQRLLVSTIEGLFVLDEEEDADNGMRIDRSVAVPGNAYGIALLGNRVLVSDVLGLNVATIGTDSTTRVPGLPDTPMVFLATTPDGERVLSGSKSAGVVELGQDDGQVKVLNQYMQDEGGAHGLVQFFGGHAWTRVGPLEGPNEVARMTRTENGHTSIKIYSVEQGLPAGHEIELHHYGGYLVAVLKIAKSTGEQHLYRYLKASDAFERIDSVAALLNPTVELPKTVSISQDLAYVRQLEQHPQDVAQLFTLGTETASWSWFNDGPISWVGLKQEGLLRVDFSALAAMADAKAKVTLWRMEHGGRPYSLSSGISEMPFVDTTTQIDFGLDVVGQPYPSMFRTRLLGLSSEWSSWSTSASLVYPALREGSYQLQIQGRDGWSRSGEGLAFEFEISPPWWRTTLAYIMGVLSLLIAVGLLVRARFLAVQTREVAVAVRESESRYRLLAENTADVIYVLGLDGRIAYASPSTQQVFGFAPEERIGKLFSQTTMSEGSKQQAETLLDSVRSGEFTEGTFEMQHATKWGDSLWSEIHARVVLSSSGKPESIIAILRDITERRAAEAALRESEEHFRELTERSVDPIFSCDHDGVITYASPGSERLWGVPPSLLVGKSFDYSLVGEEKKLARAGFNRLKAGETQTESFELQFKSLKNHYIWTETRSWSVIVGGEFCGVEYMVRDVTERKEDQKLLQRQRDRLVEHARELVTVNQQLEDFSSTVSHDLRGPLRRIKHHLEAIAVSEESSNEDLRKALEESDELTKLVDRLLELARSAQPIVRNERVDIGTLVRGVVAKSGRLTGRACELIAPLPGELIVNSDEQLLTLLMTNLVDNAYKYTPSRRDLRIEVGSISSEAGEQVYLTDNGDGFPVDQLEQLFDFGSRGTGTTDKPGYGIGLSTARHIVRQLGGQIWADNASDGGARIRFALRS